VVLYFPEFSSYCNGVVLGGVGVCPSLSLVVVCHVVSPLLCDGSVWKCLSFGVMVWGLGSMWASEDVRGAVLFLLYGLKNFVWDDCVVVI
jgi:hypothetical protein